VAKVNEREDAVAVPRVARLALRAARIPEHVLTAGTMLTAEIPFYSRSGGKSPEPSQENMDALEQYVHVVYLQRATKHKQEWYTHRSRQN
jgi:hypothetical protein